MTYELFAGLVTGFTTGITLAIIAIPRSPEPAKFTVLGKFKECEIVRFTPPDNADPYTFHVCGKSAD